MSPLLLQAIDLVIYGMGTVFVFLTVLVGVTKLMSYLLRSEQNIVDLGPRLTKSEEAVDPRIIAAISAAVKRHRHSKQ